MKKKLLNKISILAAMACICLQGHAQTGFRYKAALDTVPQNGFYQITLLPGAAALLQPGLPDIRVMDAEGKQVPYILKSDLPAFSENKFKELPIISNKKEADKQTHVVIENTPGGILDQLLLVIKNTDANRTASLSGSDDNSNWYIIKENISLNNFFTTGGDHFIQALSFPGSRYRYFKIIINGKDVLPVNIVKAGVYEQSYIHGKFLLLPPPRIIHKDSVDNYSYIFLRYDKDYFIDRLELQVSGVKFYNRSLQVYTGAIGSAALAGDYTLRSGIPAVFPLGVKTNHLLLKIRNDDNPPLQITAVGAFQLNRYLFTWLDKGKQYSLLFGDSAATAPVYDLQYFKDSIGATPVELAYGKTEINQQPGKEKPAEPKDSRALVWTALILSLAALVTLTVKMTRDINKRNS